MSGSSSDADRDVRFARVLAEFGPALRRVAASYERLAAPREDLVQEIALALWLALPRFRGECSLRTFIFRVAHNCAVSYSCRRKRLPTTDQDAAATVEDPREGPEHHAARREQSERLRRAIQALPLVYRQVLSLLLEDLSRGEIAAVLGITENATAIRLTRARKALRDALGVSS